MLKQDQRFLCDVHLLEHSNYSIMAWIRPESQGQTLTLLNCPKMFSRWCYDLLRSKVMRIWRGSLDSNPSLRLFLTTLNRSATRSMVFFQVYFAFVAFFVSWCRECLQCGQKHQHQSWNVRIKKSRENHFCWSAQEMRGKHFSRSTTLQSSV